jgi:hypothetical protein
MKKLLIITGPQGSGNHLFSRLLSLHPDVQGWEEMLTNYWIPSDQEPFAEYWVNPEKLTAEHFKDKRYHLANVSCPFFFDGVRYVPKIVEVARRAKSLGVDVSIAIIVRDQNINQLQQLRVRKQHTTPIAQDYYYNTLLPSGFPVHFLDHEAFFLHTTHYLKWVSTVLDFPIAYNDPNIMNFITEDANHKYVAPIESHWLDEVILAGCKPDRNLRLDSDTDK